MPHADLGTFRSTGLIDARKQLHHALQLVAAGARSFSKPLSDDAHANLTWVSDSCAMVTQPLGDAETQPRLALRLDKPMVALIETSGTWIELPLTGRIRTEAAGWLRSQMAIRDLGAAHYMLECPYEISHHPVADGARYFEHDEVAAGTPEELARWFDLAAIALNAVHEREEDASDVRCWPHHFDIATIIALDPQEDLEDAPSVGVGMSPGDKDIEQPYFYVTPWPTPHPDTYLPDLPLGHWRTEGWTGAVLTGEELLAADGETAAEQLDGFLSAAITAARTLKEEQRS